MALPCSAPCFRTAELQSRSLADQTEATVMVAIQGPKVIDKIGDALSQDLKNLKRYHIIADSFMRGLRT